MRVDISLWNNEKRLRERVRNMGSIVGSLATVNGFYTFSQGQWLLVVINAIFLLSIIPLFMSYSKWLKLPPALKSNGRTKKDTTRNKRRKKAED